MRTFDIVPALPPALAPLDAIARNLWWCWSPDAIQMFHDLDSSLWSASRHNPILLLARCRQERLDQMSRDAAYVSRVTRIHAQMRDYMAAPGRFPHLYPEQTAQKATIAYFCAEYGLTESLRNYSGGLGILAGDHLKTASDLNIPLVALGLFYRQGYFEQVLDEGGYQHELYPEIDPAMVPFEKVRDAAGQPVSVSIPLPGRPLRIEAWKVQVGRLPLYLLDTNLPQNTEADRLITLRLYGGNSETRIQQELVLGIGGRRFLAALGIKPTVRHLNEGHAAFLSLEDMRLRMEHDKLSFDEALAATRGGQVFTTHTPVAAGIDKFDIALTRRYLEPVAEQMWQPIEKILDMGARDGSFSMAVLALNTCDGANGVARLHGEVSRRMWAELWPGLSADEVPIGHVTNGVHLRSWMGGEFYRLLSHYLPAEWAENPEDPAMWEAIAQIPDDDLWRMHERYRRSMIRFTRRRLVECAELQGGLPDEIARAKTVLDDRILTIGFARRFATYKRGALILSQPERLLKLLRHADRPLQLVFSGKAHPADNHGKEVIARIQQFAREHRVENRLVVVENYDMQTGRIMTHGVDVWLNTPRRPLEASGTSGMKAALNGVPQCSILDGWWDEGYSPESGWAIGRRTATYADEAQQDKAEAELLYDLLENHLIPAFYERDQVGTPHLWVARMKATLRQHGPMFNTHRMLLDYCRQYYMPAHARNNLLVAGGNTAAKALAGELALFHEAFPKIAFAGVKVVNSGAAAAGSTAAAGSVCVGESLSITATVSLGGLPESRVRIQACYGPVGPDGKLAEVTETLDLAPAGESREAPGLLAYQGVLRPELAGRHGLALRAIPRSDLLPNGATPGLLVWEGGEMPFSPQTAVLMGSGH